MTAKKGTWLSRGIDPLDAMRLAARVALRDAGEMVLEESTARVPIRTKKLQRSGAYIVDPQKDRVSIFYTDRKAAAVHEDGDVKFRYGRTWKFLELAVNENADEIYRAIGARMRQLLGG